MTRPLLLLLFFAFLSNIASAQLPGLDAEKIANELDQKGPEANKEVYSLDSMLVLRDSSLVMLFLNKLEEKGQSKGYHFHARFNALKAGQIYQHTIYLKNVKIYSTVTREQIKQLLREGIDEAYRSGDEYLIAFVSLFFGKNINHYGETGLSVMYVMNGIDLYDKLSYPNSPEDYQFLAEMLYRVREYKDCIKYGHKAIDAWNLNSREIKYRNTVSCMNTVALGYHRQQVYDSAFTYYRQALELAQSTNDPIWVGIVSGNMGQIYYGQGQYDTAYALLLKDYKTSRDSGFYDNSANSLQWLARTDLARGNKTKALAEVRESFELLKLWPDAYYLRNAYYTTTQIYRAMGMYDSAFHYNNLFVTINDSLEKLVNTSSIDISKARLNDEVSKYNIQKLNNERSKEILRMNVIIAAIIAVSVFSIMRINKRRLKHKQESERVEREKLTMEKEMALARDQLKMFTENIVEKTNLIERLEQRVNDKEISAEQQQIISDLSQQTILTEADWMKFKSLFEKIHPAFFIKLKQKSPDITLAEQRMAALIRLNLTTKQMAAILGISMDSVHKTKQRLRQRMQINTDINLEEIMRAI
ncbi:MAG: tetratricopeptide repeat protein [Bacteroidetes bacterium]|nr:tetratricopeptide repeat protein [Bacteroidota bacterium]